MRVLPSPWVVVIIYFIPSYHVSFHIWKCHCLRRPAGCPWCPVAILITSCLCFCVVARRGGSRVPHLSSLWTSCLTFPLLAWPSVNSFMFGVDQQTSPCRAASGNELTSPSLCSWEDMLEWSADLLQRPVCPQSIQVRPRAGLPRRHRRERLPWVRPPCILLSLCLLPSVL